MGGHEHKNTFRNQQILMIYIIPITILFIIITISISIFFQKVVPFISLLTVISTLLLALYQLSKEVKQIDFTLQLFPDIVGPKGVPIKSPARLIILNTGHRVVYFKNFSLMQGFDTAIFINSEIKKISILKKIFNKINKKWFEKQIQKSQDSIFIEVKVSEEKNKPHNKKPYSFAIHSGDIIEFFFNYTSYIDFLKKGQRFFIKDSTGKRFYLPKDKVANIKKLINNLKTGHQ